SFRSRRFPGDRSAADRIEMLLPVACRSHARLQTKGAGEGALIVKAAVQRDDPGGAVRRDEFLTGGADALADEVAHRGFAEEFAEDAGELPLREVRQGGEFPRLDGLAVAGVEMAQGGLHLLEGMRHAADLVDVVEDDRDATDLPGGIAQWGDRDDIPVQ